MTNPKAEVDAWEARRQELKRRYIEVDGMAEADADEKATLDVRREIRTA